MSIKFDTCFDRLMGAEGGYSNDPNDPGGETNWGISKRSYPGVDIKSLTREGARIIYLRDFWNNVQLDQFPLAVSYEFFDFAVNSGIQTAIRYIQRAIKVADDGYWGPVSEKALRSTELNDLLFLYTAERLDFMTRLSNWPHAGRGWARRIAQVLRYAAKDNDSQL